MSETREEKIARVAAMGFDEEQVIIALSRARNDADAAIRLLTTGTTGGEDDAEFDLIAKDGPEPAVHPAAKNLKKTAAATHEVINEQAVAENEDSRISSLREMGFTFEESQKALDDCHGDVNEALSLLLAK